MSEALRHLAQSLDELARGQFREAHAALDRQDTPVSNAYMDAAIALHKGAQSVQGIIKEHGL